MNIAKVYDDWHKAKSALYLFGEINHAHIKELKYREMKVRLLNGSTIHFIVVKEVTDVYRTSGHRFSLVDLDLSSTFDPEVVNFLMSRIRCIDMVGGCNGGKT